LSEVLTRMAPRGRRFNRNKGRRGRPWSGSIPDTVVTAPFSVPSFYLDQASTGNGGFTTAVSASSFTAANGLSLDPFSIGGNVYQMASLFSYYRIRRLRLTYIPFSSSSGVASIPSGVSTTPSYTDRAFAIQFTGDPAFTNSSFTSILASTGKAFNTSRRGVLDVRGPLLGGWKYTTTTASTPLADDLRMACVGRLQIAFSDTSTTQTQRFGIFLLSGVADYRGILDRAVPIGVSLLSGGGPGSSARDISSLEPEEKEEEYILPPTALVKTVGVVKPKARSG